MSADAKPRISRTIDKKAMRLAQRRHAQAVVILSAAGVAIAGGLWLTGHPPDACDLAILVVAYTLATIGISVGFHRHFTHTSFKAAVPLRVVLGILGSMAMQGTLKFWVSLHRRHHEYSDHENDPHSPYVLESGEKLGRLAGLWHSYIGWSFNHAVPNSAYYARDLMRDRAMSHVNRLYFVWVVLGFALPALAGGLLHHSWVGALSGLAWGGFIRLWCGHNMIWAITSLTHVFGRRDFRSGDESTNNGWLCIYTLGESWHNNHHAFPSAAVLWFRWYQVDLSCVVIRMFQCLGLAWDIGVPSKRLLAAKAQPHVTTSTSEEGR